jgi:MFS family permease
MADAPASSPYLLFRTAPAFRRYWSANAAASFGFQMMSVGVGWQVYDITHRALDLGLVGLMQFIPSVLLALPAGHAADRYNRRTIVMAGQVVSAVSMALLALLTALQVISESEIFLLVAAISVAMAFAFPSRGSMLPELVPPALLPRAVAVNASAGQAAMIVGPALGGLLYLAGPSVLYAVSAALCFAAAAILSGVSYSPSARPRERATLHSLFAGVRFIRGNPDVLGVISLDLFAVLLGGATALLPIYARDILMTGPWGLGLLRAAPAVGALLMSFWLARHPLQRKVGMIMFGAVAGFGLATLVFAVSTVLWLSLAALFLLGAFDMVSMVIRGALVQLDTPDEMRGRVSSVNAVFINTSNQLGEFESGFLAAWVGAVASALIGGIGTILVVGIWMGLFPGLRRRERLHSRRDG